MHVTCIAFHCRQYLHIDPTKLTPHSGYGHNGSGAIPHRNQFIEEQLLMRTRIAIHSPYELVIDNRGVKWFAPVDTGIYTTAYRRSSVLYLNGRE